MGGKESDRTLMTVESSISGREDSVAEASSISLPRPILSSAMIYGSQLFFFVGASCRPLMSGLSQAVQISDNALFQTLIKVS